MRKGSIWRLMAVLMALALVAAACGDSDSTADTTTTTAAPGTTTTAADTTTTTEAPMVCEATIGFIGPVTGPVAFIGEVQRNWMQYAVDTLNTELGTTIDFVEGDNQFDTAQSATLAQQFLDNAAILGTVGPAGSDQVDAAGAVFEAGDPNFTFISPSSTRVGITDKYTGMFRTVPTDADQGPSSAQFLIDRGATKVFMVDDQSSYSVGLADEVVSNLEAANVEVIRESVAQDVTDFSALVSTIPDDAEFVYLPWQVAANGQIFANQMNEQGKTATIFGSDGMDDSENFVEPGSFVAGFAPDIAGIEGSQDLLAGFLAEYPATNTFGPPVYVAAQVLIESIYDLCLEGAELTRANVQAKVRDYSADTSILGSPVSFQANGDLDGGKFFFFEVQEDGSRLSIG